MGNIGGNAGYDHIDKMHFAIADLVVGPLAGDQSWGKWLKCFFESRTFVLLTETNAFGLCWRSFGLQTEFKVSAIIRKAQKEPECASWRDGFCPLGSWPALQLAVVSNAGTYKKVIIIT